MAARAKKTSARGEARPDEEFTLVVGAAVALVLVPEVVVLDLLDLVEDDPVVVAELEESVLVTVLVVVAEPEVELPVEVAVEVETALEEEAEPPVKANCSL